MNLKNNSIETVDLVLIGRDWRDKAIRISEQAGTTAFLHDICYEFSRVNAPVYSVQVYVRTSDNDLAYHSTWTVNYEDSRSLKRSDLARVK